MEEEIASLEAFYSKREFWFRTDCVLRDDE